MGTMAPSTILFDLDGTIWDSYRIYSNAMCQKGFDYDSVYQQLLNGVPVARLLRKAGITHSRFNQFLISTKDNPLFPGVKEVLDDLIDKEIPMGIVTSLPGWISTPMLNVFDLMKYFSSVVDWNCCKKKKPSPEPLLLALEELHNVPDDTVYYIGDSITDCQAAKAAGITFVFASYGYGKSDPNQVDIIITSFDEVLLL